MIMFSEYLRAAAAWRREKAKEHPEDRRNAQSALAIEALADYVESGHADRQLLYELERFTVALSAGTGVPSLGEETQRAISRYGFGHEVSSDLQRDQMLGDLLACAAIDTYEVVMSGTGGDESDDDIARVADAWNLHPWEVRAALDGVLVDRGYFKSRSRLIQADQQAWLDACRTEVDGK